MRLDRNAPAQGSFGIPPQIQEAAQRQREAKAKAEAPAPEPVATPAPIEITEPDKAKGEKTPIERLAEVGATFEDNDFQKLLFKGFYEAELEVFKGFKATYRTLNGREYDEADELLAEEIRDTPMTNEGLETRRAMWLVAYGVTHLMGKPVGKITLNADKTVDSKETARTRRKVLAELAPQTLNRLISTIRTITDAINAISASPGQYLKNF